MTRLLCLCALILPSWSMAVEPPKEEVFKLTLSPEPLPRPALKYQLLPELTEMKPGNPIHGYLRCFSEQNNFFFNKKVNEQREKWSSMPLEKLPVDQLKGYGGTALTQADYAARLTTPDWQALPHLRKDGARMLLPDVQQMRMLARALTVRFRGEVAGKRFEEALGTAKTMFAMAKHFEHHPTLISSLVGFAIAVITEEPLREMIQQPGCPNLFWALSILPKPLVNLHEGTQGERLLWRAELDYLIEKEAMTDKQVKQAVAKTIEMARYLEYGDRPKLDVSQWLQKRTSDKEYLAKARTRLISFGIEEKLVRNFPAVQVVLVDEKYKALDFHDEMMKLFALPYAQIEPLMNGIKKPEDTLIARYVVITPKIRLAQIRAEQRLAILQNIEAIRWYASENEGKLPKQLSEIKLPLLTDPVTGKPFRYTVSGKTATLLNTPPAGTEKNFAWNLRYILTLR